MPWMWVAVGLTDKESVLFLTRLAALNNALSAAGTQREQWQSTFLDLLYTMCTQTVPPHVRVNCLENLQANGTSHNVTCYVQYRDLMRVCLA